MYHSAQEAITQLCFQGEAVSELQSHEKQSHENLSIKISTVLHLTRAKLKANT